MAELLERETSSCRYQSSQQTETGKHLMAPCRQDLAGVAILQAILDKNLHAGWSKQRGELLGWSE